MVCVDLFMDRLAAIEVHKGELRRWVVAPIVSGTQTNGDPSDPARLASELRRALDRAGIQARRARFTLADQAAVIRYVRLPKMRARELAKAMAFVAERELPFPADRARVSWRVVADTGDGLEVCLGAAWQDVVARLQQVATLAGLKPEVVEPRSLCISRALDSEEATMLDMGPNSVHLTLLQRGRPPFSEARQLEPSDLADGVGGSLGSLMQEAARRRPTTQSVPPNLIVAGGLEMILDDLALPARRASHVLNGHRPLRPADFPAEHYIAALGLAMWSDA